MSPKIICSISKILNKSGIYTPFSITIILLQLENFPNVIIKYSLKGSRFFIKRILSLEEKGSCFNRTTPVDRLTEPTELLIKLKAPHARHF